MDVKLQGTGARKRPCFVLGILLLGAFAGDLAARPPSGGRIAAPTQARAGCPADGDLTAYFGKVVGYRRDAARTWLKIATDYGTVEAVTLVHAKGAKDGGKQFLLRGAAFSAKDWSRIESRPGLLRPGTRANAWVCNGKATLVDWNPATE